MEEAKCQDSRRLGTCWWGFSILASKRCYYQTHFRRLMETNSLATWL
uniref:Uncharacterized protein n=1 Tax=Arundo donax TaxID=35708 RepID=A0A0A8Y773_ARUDO